jgi:uncharacterized protein YraI
MRIATCILFSITLATGPSVAPAQAAGPAPQVVACDATVFVSDDDPAGLNVRAGPGTGAAVIARLREATWVHVSGSDGAWMRIDRAIIDDGEGAEGRVEFSGEGWVYGPLLGVEGAGGDDGEGTSVRAGPSADAGKVGLIQPDDGEATVQGCRGQWLQLEHRSYANPGTVVRGWSRHDETCVNPNTVCN